MFILVYAYTTSQNVSKKESARSETQLRGPDQGTADILAKAPTVHQTFESEKSVRANAVVKPDQLQ